MTLIVTWLWQGLAIATGTPSAPDLTSLDTAGALMLPPIPDGVVACAVAIWAMTAACALGFGRPVILVSRSRPFLYTRRQSCRERVSASVNRAPSVALLVEDPLCVCS